MYNSGSDQKPSEKEKPYSPESQFFFTLINNESLQVLIGRVTIIHTHLALLSRSTQERDLSE